MKKGRIIFTILLSILCFGSCGTQNKELAEEVVNAPENEASTTELPTPSGTSPDISQSITPVNTSTVVYSGGDVVIQDERIYFVNGYDSVTLYSMNIDGSDSRKLNDDWTTWFHVSDNKIYYQNGKDGKIYGMNIDGSDQQKLNDIEFDNINLVDDRIYYSNEDDEYALYSMNIDGSDMKKLNDDIPLNINVINDRIYYYNNLSGARGIYSIKTDGTDRVKLNDDNVSLMLAADGWIYYNNENDDYKLYAIRTDGSDRHKLSDDHALNINVINNQIYYNNEKDSKIYSINTEGGNKRLLSDDNAEWLIIGGTRIYYTITGAKIYSMNLDGTDKQMIADLTKDVYQDVTYEIKTRLQEDMPEYRFVAKGRTSGTDEWTLGFVMGLEVFDENGLPILTADFSQAFRDEVIGYAVYNQMLDTMGLHVVDVNFDSYKDVIILNSFSGAHSNTWYDCWLWNPETSSFDKSESFAEICNPAFDPEKKYIYSAGGEGSSSHSWQIYQFIDSEFVVTNNLSYNEVVNGGSGYHYIEQKIVNGVIEIIRDELIQADNFDDSLAAAGYISDGFWELKNARWYMYGGHHADPWLE